MNFGLQFEKNSRYVLERRATTAIRRDEVSGLVQTLKRLDPAFSSHPADRPMIS